MTKQKIYLLVPKFELRKSSYKWFKFIRALGG